MDESIAAVLEGSRGSQGRKGVCCKYGWRKRSEIDKIESPLMGAYLISI